MMKKEMEKIDMPDVHEFLDILTASGVKLWACKLAMDMFHYKKEDLYEGIDDVITVGDFYKKAEGMAHICCLYKRRKGKNISLCSKL